MSDPRQTRLEADPIDSDLRAALRTGTSAATDEHPDDLALAAYLDGGMSAAGRDRMEAHLATCDPCRELASLVAPFAALPDEEPAAAATAANAAREHATVDAGAGFGQWLGNLLGLGSPASHRFAAVAAATIMALAAVLLVPRLDDDAEPDFGSFVGDEADVVRGDLDGDVPKLLEPSFSIVTLSRPSFRFAIDGEATECRLLIVDETETSVGLAEVSVERRGDSLVVAYPDSFPDLSPGGLYAWKIDVRRDGSWVPSAFAPFRVDEAASAGASSDPP